jgi:hypothetical protein
MVTDGDQCGMELCDLHILPKGQSVRGTTMSPMVPTSPRPAPSSIRPTCGAFPGRRSTSRRIAEGMTEKPGPGLDCRVLSAAECVILGALKREPQRSKCRICLMYLTSAARPCLRGKEQAFWLRSVVAVTLGWMLLSRVTGSRDPCSEPRAFWRTFFLLFVPLHRQLVWDAA